MVNAENKQLYNKAMKKFGTANQLIMAIQEMSELTKDLTNVIMNRTEKTVDIPGEITDVLIMMEQLIEIYQLESVVEMCKTDKLERLEKLVDES